MVDRLRVIITTLEKLSPEQQERLAETLEELLEEHEWDALTARPGAAAFHDRLLEEYTQEKAAGTLTPINGDTWDS